MNVSHKGILSLVIVVLLLEAGARVVATVTDDISREDNKWFVMSADRGWELRPGFHGRPQCGVGGDFDGQGFLEVDSAQIAETGKTRILFLGDSNTFGYCIGNNVTFAEQTDELIPDASAINLGVSGYTSYQGYKTLLKYGELIRPDIIVVSFNYNDRRYVLERSETDSDQRFAEITSATRQQELVATLKISYIVRALDRLIRLAGIYRPGKDTPSRIRLDELHPRVSPESYRDNLEMMVQWARDHDSRIVLMLLGDNPVQTDYLRRGIRSLDLGRYNDAIEQLKVAMRDRQFGPLARIFLAQAYTGADMPDLAEDIISVQPYRSLHGGHPIFLDTVYNDIMKDVGNRHQLEVVDAREMLNKTPGYYIDHCHFDESGHRAVAELLRQRIVHMVGK